MDGFPIALVLIFCTPFGWFGLLILGSAIVDIVKASKR